MNSAKKWCFTVDGSLYDLIPMFLEIDLDGLQSVQPSSYKMEPARLKQVYGDSLAFMGCIDTQFVLISSSPVDVRRQVREVLEVMKPGGGFVAHTQPRLLAGRDTGGKRNRYVRCNQRIWRLPALTPVPATK